RSEIPHAHVAEDRLHALTLERLVLDELGRETLEHVAVLLEHVERDTVRGIDEPAHLGVDAGGDLFGVVRGGGEVAAQEDFALWVTEAHRAQYIAHPELRD